MQQLRMDFPNRKGERLSAALSLPAPTEPRGYVLFAHCFTCGKNIAAASRISRALTAHGFAVLRFDFTGLGNSEGDFASTNFSSNVEDLLAATDFLRTSYAAPVLLIGHSLGGAAVLAAAEQVPECQAVCTIGAPATPAHLLQKLEEDTSTTTPSYRLTVGQRSFPIQQQFVNDLTEAKVTDKLARLKRALLILHAPLDEVVSIDEASKIFQHARHPKSFISLDGADHLVSRPADAEYVADVISAWAKRYIPSSHPHKQTPVAAGQVEVSEANKKFLRQVSTDDHAWVADEPKEAGGDNLGPDPYEHLLAALGTCTSMTLRMYANHKKIPLDDVDITLHHSREHSRDCDECDEPGARIDVLSRSITLHGDLSEAQRKRLLEIADRCPVHKTLEGDIQIRTELSASS
ncbi:MAG: alpha/beta fold hydrolase [bacterium]